MKATLSVDAETTDGFVPAGTVIEHSDVLHLLATGQAEPTDDATAREWANFQQAKAQAEVNRTKRMALGKPRPVALPETVTT